MLSPDQIGAAGDAAEGAAARAGDVLVAILSAEVAEAVGAGDLAAALLGSGRVPEIVLRALGADPLMGRATASRAVREALYASARSDALAAGVEPDYGRVTASAVELEGELREVERRCNLSMAEDARASYLRIVSDLVPRAAASEISRERAVAEGVRRMAERGVRVVDYASGRRDRPEVVMRRHVQTLLKRASTDYTADLCRRLGVRLVEVDSHVGARPSHRLWQGRVYGLDGPVEVGGVRYPGLAESGAADGLNEPNCRHSMAPYVPGRARRWSETPDEDAGRDPDAAYGATQRQCANERAIRDAKREADSLRAEGLDDTAARLRLGRAQAAQRRLLADNPWLKRRPERERAFGEDGGAISVQPLNRTAKSVKTAMDEVRDRIKASGASTRRVEELVRANEGLGTLDKAGWDRVLTAAINRAAAEKARDERAAKTELNKIKPGSQRKHTLGTKEYEQKVPISRREGYEAPSALTITEEETQSLVDEFAGKGVPGLTRRGSWNGKETCDAGRPIGVVYFKLAEGRAPEQTNMFKIHYGDKGTHIVPVVVRKEPH